MLLGVRSLLTAPLAFYSHGRGAGVVAYATVMAAVLFPLGLVRLRRPIGTNLNVAFFPQVLFCLGHVRRRGVYAVFSGSPSTRGVALAMLTLAAASLLCHGPPLVHSFNYGLAALGSEVEKRAFRLCRRAFDCP